MPYSALSYSSYKVCRRFLESVSFFSGGNRSTQINLISGAVSGSVATIFTYPADMLRTRLAVQRHDRVYTSLIHAISHMYRVESVAYQQLSSSNSTTFHHLIPSHVRRCGVFFVGLSASLYGIVPYMALQFASYESLKLQIQVPSFLFCYLKCILGIKG